MNLNQINIGQILGQIFALITTLISYAFVLLVFAKITQLFGHSIPYVPAIDQVALAYLAGAWWLIRK